MTEINAVCGIAKLLAHTFDTSLTEVFPQVGLELCPRCGEASYNLATYPFCSQKHHTQYYRQAQAVPLICDECGIFFVRRESEVMAWARRGGQKIYCSNVCNGRYHGRTYGLAVNGAHAALKASVRTHCRKGHEWTPENTYWYKDIQRICRACQNIRQQRAKAKALALRPGSKQ